MPSVGPILRGARLQSGFTHEQISNRTCIPVKILQALEDDDLGKISSAFFYKSFVRQVCQLISFPYDQLTEAVNEAAAFYPEPFQPNHLHTVAQHAVLKTRKRGFNVRTLLTTASAIVVLAGCSVVYSFWEGGRSEISADANAAVSSARTWVSTSWISSSWLSSLMPGVDDRQIAAKRDPTPYKISRPPQATPNPNEGIRVEVSAIEPSWLSIVADGRQTFSGVLQADQSKFMECHENGRVRTGNAGGLKVVFNGKSMGTVGPRGQVRVVVFTRDNFEVLEPSATASLRIPRPAGPSPALASTVLLSWSGVQTQLRPLLPY